MDSILLMLCSQKCFNDHCLRSHSNPISLTTCMVAQDYLRLDQLNQVLYGLSYTLRNAYFFNIIIIITNVISNGISASRQCRNSENLHKIAQTLWTIPLWNSLCYPLVDLSQLNISHAITISPARSKATSNFCPKFSMFLFSKNLIIKNSFHLYRNLRIIFRVC